MAAPHYAYLLVLLVGCALASSAAFTMQMPPPVVRGPTGESCGSRAADSCNFTYDPPTWRIQAGYGLYSCCFATSPFQTGCAQGQFGSPNGDVYQAAIGLSADSCGGDCPPDFRDFPYIVGPSQQYSDANTHTFAACVANSYGWSGADVFFVISCVQPAYGGSCVIQFDSVNITQS